MTAPADLVLTDGEVHALTEPDEVHEAVAVRDGRIVRLGSTYEVSFLAGVETTTIDLDGRVVLPGFVDAHTHMEVVGRYEVEADLRGAPSLDAVVERLAARAAATDGGWVLGFGYDESDWPEARYPTRGDLDAVSDERPVAAFREDLHTASLNGAALERLAGDLPAADVRTADGEPTGMVVEAAVDPVFDAVAPDRQRTRELVVAARDRAHALGVTCVHDMCRRSHKPRVYRELEGAGDLDLRVRLCYWADHLDAVRGTGLVDGHGSGLVTTGPVKTYTDGSIGARTAKVSEPYADAGDDAPDAGQWVVAPDELAAIVETADDAGLQVAAHAIGDEAVGAVLDAYAEHADDAAAARHRVEHAELLDDELVERFARVGAVASVQPNFLKWAREGGLYDRALGTERARGSNRFRQLLDAGVPVAFGSDCMPMGPLFGVQQAVTAPDDRQRLSVTEALRAYTAGGAHAGGDEHRLGTVAVGNCADLVVLERSPWAVDPGAIADVAVAATVVDGAVVHRG